MPNLRVEAGARVLATPVSSTSRLARDISHATANSSLTLDSYIYNEDNTSSDVFTGLRSVLSSSQRCVICLAGDVETVTFMDELIFIVIEAVKLMVADGAISLTWTSLSPLDSSPAMHCGGHITGIEDAITLLDQGRHSMEAHQRRGQLHSLITLNGAHRRVDFIQLASHVKPTSSRSLSLSLNTLASVITALKPSRSNLPLPWRDSPLTLWLKQALKDADSLLFLGYLSPLPGESAHSMATLSFVSRQRSRQGSGLKVSAIFESSIIPPSVSAKPDSHLCPQLPALNLARADLTLTCDQGSQVSVEEIERDVTVPHDHSPAGKGSPYDVILYLKEELEATRRKIGEVDAEARCRDEEAEAQSQDREARLAAALSESQVLAHELDVKQQQLNEVSSSLADALKARSEIYIANDDLKREVRDLQTRLLDSVSRAEKEESLLKQLGATATRSRLNESSLHKQVLHLTKALDDSQKERTRLEVSEGRAKEEARVSGSNLEEVKLALGLVEQDLLLGKKKQESLAAQVGSSSSQLVAMKGENEALQRTLEAQRKSGSNAVDDLGEMEAGILEFVRSLETTPIFDSLWRRVKREERGLLMLPSNPMSRGGMEQSWSVLKPILKVMSQDCEQVKELKSKLEVMENSLEERQRSLESTMQLEEQIHCLDQDARAGEAELAHTRSLLAIAEEEISRRNEMLKGLNNDRELFRLQALSALESTNQDLMAAESLRHQLKAREDSLDRLWVVSLQAKSSLENIFPELILSNPDSPALDWSDPGSFNAVESFLVDMQGSVRRLVSENEAAKRSEAGTRYERDFQEEELERLASLLSVTQKDKSVNMSRVSALESELTLLLAKLSDSSSFEKKLSSENLSLKNDLKNAEKEVRHLDESRRGLLDELNIISASAASWKDASQRLEEEAREKERLRVIERAEITRLENEVIASKKEQQQSEASRLIIQARAEEAESQLDDCRSRLGSTSRVASESQSKMTDALTRLALVETDARIKVSALEDRLMASEDGLAMAQSKLKEKTDEMDQWMRDVGEENVQLQLELDKASGEQQEADSLVKQLRNSYESQLSEIKAFAAKMTRERDQLSEVVDQQEQLQRQLEMTKREGDRAKERERSLLIRVQELQVEVNSSHGEMMRLAGLLEVAKL